MNETMKTTCSKLHMSVHNIAYLTFLFNRNNIFTVAHVVFFNENSLPFRAQFFTNKFYWKGFMHVGTEKRKWFFEYYYRSWITKISCIHISLKKVEISFKEVRRVCMYVNVVFQIETYMINMTYMWKWIYNIASLFA